MFMVSGQLEGRPVHAVWVGGGWGDDGDPELLARLGEVPVEPVLVTPTGPAWVADSRTAQGALAAALAVLDARPAPVLEGPSAPAFPAVPEDAVA